MKRLIGLFSLILLQLGLGHAVASSDCQMEQTLSIIKPDAVEKNAIGNIINRFEKEGLAVVAIKMVKLSQSEAEAFYSVHRDRPFFSELTKWMSSAPIVVMVLEGENAIALNRKLMGATNPEKADKGTIRADWGESIQRNAVHGSDSPKTASEEISFFFKHSEIVRVRRSC